MSALLGSVGGLIWAEVLSMLRGRPFNYIMTVATLFPVYIMSEEVIGPGGGPIAALAFGLAITNYGYLTRRLGLKRTARVDRRRIREFNQEFTFLIKAFFFVYLGLIVSFSLWYALVGLGIMALMLITRYVVATGVSKLLMFTDGEKVFSRVVYMQGASALIFAQLPIVFDPERLSFKAPEIFGDLCFPIIIGTVIFVSVLGPLIARRQLRGTKLI